MELKVIQSAKRNIHYFQFNNKESTDEGHSAIMLVNILKSEKTIEINNPLK